METTRWLDTSTSKELSVKLIAYKSFTPRVHPSAFLADGVWIIGNVQVDKDASIWFNTVIRGDINEIRIGARTNVQDGCVIHVTHKHAVHVGSDVTIGHRAIIHGSTIEDFSLVGMGAVVLDNAHVGPYALIAAGAVVPGNAVIGEGKLAAGVPARIVRDLTEEEKLQLRQSAEGYVDYARGYQS